MTASPQVALVTGASSGIGKAATLALADAGFQVIGTSRDTSRATPGDGVTFLDLDVTSDESVTSVVGQVIDTVRAPRRPGQQRRCRRQRRRRGDLRRPGPDGLRRQRLRPHAHDEGRPAAHARQGQRTHHQRLVRRRVSSPTRSWPSTSRPSTRSRAIPSRWTTRSANTASGCCASSPARSTPRSTPTRCRPTPRCRSTRTSGASSRTS